MEGRIMNFDELSANLTLLRLNNKARRESQWAPPVARETAKAMTVAQLHRDVEARVICNTIDEAAWVCALLCGETAKSIGGKWSMKDLTLELPNGSAVVVVLDVERMERAAVDRKVES
jgi:hypothetical protein